MSLGQNVLAGLANSAWTVLANLIAIPFYIHYLGIEAYGLIGFLATLQAVLQVLDFGLGPTINREVARAAAQRNFHEARILLHTLAIVYWLLAGVLVSGIALMAHVISTRWLDARQISSDTVTKAIVLIGLIIACRWPVGLYQGALMGAQRLVACSTLSMMIVTLNTLGSVAVLAWVSNNIQALFTWQAIVALMHALALRSMAWRTLGRHTTGFEIAALQRVWKFSAGMIGVAASGLFISQMDKVLLSKLLDLSTFGEYMLATTVASSLYVLVTPIFNASYPRFSTLIAQSSTSSLVTLYHLASRLLACLLFSAAMVLIVFGQPIIHAWTGNAELATTIAPIAAVLAAGIALHGMMHIPYALQIAYGTVRIPLAINLLLLLILTPLILMLASRWGAIGAACAWLSVHAFYIGIGTPVTHRLLMPSEGLRWLGSSLGLPLGVALLVGLIGHYINKESRLGLLGELLLAGMMALTALAVSIVLSPALLKAIQTNLSSKPSAFCVRENA